MFFTEDGGRHGDIMELIDVVNEKDEVIGIKDKDAVHRDGDLHRTVRIYVINSKGEMLIHKRAASKKLHPGFWDTTVGGHIHSGETYEVAAKRELKEELGIENTKLFEIGKWMGRPNASNPLERLIVKIFLVKFDGIIEDLKFDKKEISQIRLIKISEMDKIIKKEKFVYTKDFEERVKTLKTFVKLNEID